MRDHPQVRAPGVERVVERGDDAHSGQSDDVERPSCEQRNSEDELQFPGYLCGFECGEESGERPARGAEGEEVRFEAVVEEGCGDSLIRTHIK